MVEHVCANNFESGEHFQQAVEDFCNSRKLRVSGPIRSARKVLWEAAEQLCHRRIRARLEAPAVVLPKPIAGLATMPVVVPSASWTTFEP